MGLFIGFYPFQTYLSHKIYPKLPINLCFLSYGSTFDIDVYTDNKKDCFDIRANEKKEWQSCLFTYDPGNCLGSISLKTDRLLCEKTPDKKERNDCYGYAFRNAGNLVHQLGGIHDYRKDRSITGKVGDRLIITLTSGNKYLITLIAIEGDGVDINTNSSRLYCSKKETSPIPVISYSGGYQHIYIDGCRITNNGITLDYFIYEFPGQPSLNL